MKKFTVLTVLLTLTASIFAAAPAFEDPKAVVFDLNAIEGKAKSDICVVNATHENALTVTISVYETKKQQWSLYGSVNLQSITDAMVVTPQLKGALKNYSHVAVVPSINTQCKILAAKVNNVLRIAVLSLEEPSEYATVMDVFALDGSFKDNVRLINQSSASNVGFDVYTQKDNSDTWFKVGTAYLKGRDDTCFVQVVTPDPVASYRYFAVISHDGNDYAYEAKKERNDLLITVK